ncbi:MAG: hypothetical protein R3F54_25455 [Alphaproteobacteria bacterium]
MLRVVLWVLSTLVAFGSFLALPPYDETKRLIAEHLVDIRLASDPSQTSIYPTCFNLHASQTALFEVDQDQKAIVDNLGGATDCTIVSFGENFEQQEKICNRKVTLNLPSNSRFHISPMEKRRTRACVENAGLVYTRPTVEREPLCPHGLEKVPVSNDLWSELQAPPGTNEFTLNVLGKSRDSVGRADWICLRQRTSLNNVETELCTGAASPPIGAKTWLRARSDDYRLRWVCAQGLEFIRFCSSEQECNTPSQATVANAPISTSPAMRTAKTEEPAESSPAASPARTCVDLARHRGALFSVEPGAKVNIQNEGGTQHCVDVDFGDDPYNRKRVCSRYESLDISPEREFVVSATKMGVTRACIENASLVEMTELPQ